MMFDVPTACQMSQSAAQLAPIPTAPRGRPFHTNDPRITTDRPTTQLQEARRIQRLIFQRCQNPKTDDAALASLARSFCLVQDTIREIRGIPCAGQYRPEISEKRARNVIEMANGAATFAESPPAKAPTHRPIAESPPPTTEATSVRATETERTTAEGEKPAAES